MPILIINIIHYSSEDILYSYTGKSICAPSIQPVVHSTLLLKPNTIHHTLYTTHPTPCTIYYTLSHVHI
ncbi:hypothetical protein EON63_09815 [archaeon]|nr:MAG: hypothetical protein EON63_09815 [archaeon]